MKVEYILDKDVDRTLDKQLRSLLSRCFTKPSDERFITQRYYNEMPQHRWLVRSKDKTEVIAHVAVHEKSVTFQGQQLPIAGVAEVCVHPDHRGNGHVKHLLARAHQWMLSQGYLYSVLFGKDEIYGSSGYQRVTNLYLVSEQEPYTVTAVSAMVLTLKQQQWPASNVELKGLSF
ncbi:GNAT family N-acetyltransferase [Vibrio parahaemolyticus]